MRYPQEAHRVITPRKLGQIGTARRTASLAACAAITLALIAGCTGLASARIFGMPPAGGGVMQAIVNELEDNLQYLRVYIPLRWDVNTTYIVGRQGQAGLWGTCGECCIANTINLALSYEYTESAVVNFVLEQGLCDPSSGGMSTNHMLAAYGALLPSDCMAVYCHDGAAALTIDGLARKLERGSLLNLSVYGEMMREGGHVGEGELYGTHWIVLYGTQRDDQGRVSGFYLIDSASDITYLSASALSDVYYGHDGTWIINPTCLEIYAWKYADGAPLSEVEIAPFQ